LGKLLVAVTQPNNLLKMTNLKASQLSLEEVERNLKYVQTFDEISFDDLLSLEPLTEYEQQELERIRTDFRPYLKLRKGSEGQVKALTTYPLLRLAGFYSYPILIKIEEGIDRIVIEDEDNTITGRFDILTVNKSIPTENNIPFWLLVIESKEVGVEVRQGLPQLLTYAYKSLERQSFVWGMATNGLQHLFVYMRQGNPPTYQLMPELHLLESQRSIELVRVLKAVCKLQNFQAPLQAAS
jgi:hypothetical protein